MKHSCRIATVLLVLLLTLLVGGIASAQDPPAVTTNAATDVTTDSATLNGMLTSLGNASSVDVSFQWGLTTSYGNETTPQTMTTTGAFNDAISSLDPGTTYHFRAKAVGNGTAFGNDVMFTTGTTPPAVTTNAATDVTNDSATLNGNLTSMGTASSVDVSFEYGLTTSYGNETTPQTMTTTGTFNDTISSLDPDTTYHFRAKAIGNGTAFGNALTLTTETAERIELQGWGWCTDYGEIVEATLDGYVTMVERSHASHSFSLHVTGNLTMQLPGAADEVIPLDLYGSRVRSLFYLRQEITGKSATLTGTWIDAGGGQYYILTDATIALPNPQGEALKTARVCFLVLRTPEVEVPLEGLGSFVEDIESMLTRLVRFVDNLLDSLIGTGLGEILSDILTKIATLLAALRELGVPYVP